MTVVINISYQCYTLFCVKSINLLAVYIRTFQSRKLALFASTTNRLLFLLQSPILVIHVVSILIILLIIRGAVLILGSSNSIAFLGLLLSAIVPLFLSLPLAGPRLVEGLPLDQLLLGFFKCTTSYRDLSLLFTGLAGELDL